MRDTQEKVLEIIENVLGRGASGDRLREDLGMDSLDEVELILSLEEGFGIEIPDEDAARYRTVQDIVDYIEKRTFQ